MTPSDQTENSAKRTQTSILVTGTRPKEIEATKEVLDTAGFEITDEEADRILDMEIDLGEDTSEKDGEYDLFPLSDTEDELFSIAKKVLNGTLSKSQVAMVSALCEKGVVEKLTLGGEPVWLTMEEVDYAFDVPEANRYRGHYAWYLSQPPGASYYIGEWFERKGKFIKDENGNNKLSSNGIPKFRTKHIRLTRDALKVITFLAEKIK